MTISWLFIGVLLVLCAVLGVLQYRWIGEVSIAARERLRASLQASLERVSREFQTELAGATRAILPEDPNLPPTELAKEVGARYGAWKSSSHMAPLIRTLAVATHENEVLVLHYVGPDGSVRVGDWPAEWKPLRDAWLTLPSREGRGGFRGGMPVPAEPAVFEMPIFAFGPPNERDPGPRRNMAWMILELDPTYAGESLIPELLQRHLGSGSMEYQFEITPRGEPSTVLYASEKDAPARIAANADASAPFADIGGDLFRGRGRGGRAFDPRGPAPAVGHWELYVRHRSGSLEAVVEKTRWRNLAVTSGLLLLILASAAALLTFTRRSQRLAELQMNFVAGVSHELRTPLTVINTAAFNLQNKVSQNPEQVVKYGTLIRQESGRLKELVEQVLSFAGSQAGRMTQERQPLAVEALVDSSLEASRSVIEGGHFVVEKDVASGLPLIEGDPRALQHAIQNLLTNAVKYGSGNGSGNWIGVSARGVVDARGKGVEIRVSDHGPGIPADEQGNIFDPFYRGKRAVQDQVHGTGLGLTLVKEIVTAHQGSIAVRSQAGKGTDFVIRIPAAAVQEKDEFANSSG